MEKKCFIIVPVSDPDGYAQGHFNRVYDYIVAPACRSAGFWPTRADSSTDNALEIIKNIIDSDMAICDLSAKNSTALYGLAIRQALDLPVTLIKDLKSQTSFSIMEQGVVEYDESLRIDTVQKEVEILKEALGKTFEAKAVTSPLLDRLNIGPRATAPIIFEPVINTTFDEPAAQEEVAPKESALPIISPLPDYVGDPITETGIEKLKVGDFLFHMNHGKGEIRNMKKMGKDKIAELLFDSGPKTLVIGTPGFFRKIIA